MADQHFNDAESTPQSTRGRFGKALGRLHDRNGTKPRNGRATDDWPPTNTMAEIQTLASLLILGRGFEYPEVIALRRPGCFTDIARQRTFAKMEAASDSGQPIHATVVAHQLVDDGTFDNYEAAHSFLKKIIETEATGAGLRTYAEKVSEAAEQRKLCELHQELGQQIKDRLKPANVRGFLEEYLQCSGEPASGRIEYESISLADLKNAAEPEYYIPGFLSTSQPGVIAGQWKALKTTIAAALSYSIATEGHPFLGKFDVSIQARVGLFSGEAGRVELRKTVERIARFHGDENPWRHDGLIFSCERLPKIGSKPYMDALVRWIECNRLRICIIDPGYAALAAIGDGAGNYYKVAELLFQVTELQKQTGCLILLCPHMTKAPKYDQPMLSDIQWSGFPEWAGQWLLLGKRREWDDQTGQHWLWLVAGGRSGHAATYGLDVREGLQTDIGGKVFEPTILDKAEAFGTSVDAQSEQKERQQRREQEKAEQSIREAFRALGDGWHIKTHVLERTGTSGRGRAITMAWAAMLRRKEIITEPGACHGGKGSPCDGYRIHRKD